jgi:hypothetical protein
MWSHIKTLSTLIIFALTTLFLAQVVAVASAQDANGQEAQTQPRKRLPNPPPDNTDVILPSFSLEIKAEKTTAKIGERLKVEVTITNTDSEDIFYDGYGHQPEFGLEVRDETDRQVARVPGASVEGGSATAVAIHPGESIHRSARLDKEFELDKPGNYFVRATRGVSKTNLRRSNTITITIIP